MRNLGLAVALLAATAFGCKGPASDGPARHTVSGSVTLDGKPLEEGWIVLESPDDAALGLAPASSEIKGGQYSLTVTLGEKTVKISRQVESGRDPITKEPILKESIPAKYNAKSELKFTVSEGENAKDFAL